MSNEGELKPIPDKCFCGAKMIYVTSMNDTMHNLKCCNPAHSIVITASKAKLIEILEYIYNNTRPAQSYGWIPVSDRLPEESGYYITTRIRTEGGSPLAEAFYNAKYNRWGLNRVIAWQPFPAPYIPAPSAESAPEANDE